MSTHTNPTDLAQPQRVPSPVQSKYPMAEEQWARLDRDFTYHAPKNGQPERYVALRKAARQFAINIFTSTPPSDLQEQALGYLGLAVMLANAAIARHE